MISKRSQDHILMLIEKHNIPSHEESEVMATLCCIYETVENNEFHTEFTQSLAEGRFNMAESYAGPIDKKYITLYKQFLKTLQ